MIRSILCNFSDAYIDVKATIAVSNATAVAAPVNKTNKKIIFKNYPPFTNDISKINNTQVDYAQDIEVAMSKYNLIE